MARQTKASSQLRPGDVCFVCARILTPSIATDEHIVPRWLQRAFSLWDQTYGLRNGANAEAAVFRYDRLKVPCCRPCNERMGTAIEEPMRRAALEGALAIDPLAATMWLAKMNCGFAAFDARRSAAVARAGGRLASDTPADVRDTFNVERFLLQKAGMTALTFEPPTWSSVFVYETQVSPIPQQNFDFIDHTLGSTVAIRLGRLGIVGVLFDCGLALSEAGIMHNAFKAQPLNPMQFREIAAFAHALGAHRVETGVFASASWSEDADGVHVTVKSEHDDLLPPVDVYARLLANAWDMTVPEVLRGDLLLTSLVDDNREGRHLAFDERVRMPT